MSEIDDALAAYENRVDDLRHAYQRLVASAANESAGVRATVEWHERNLATVYSWAPHAHKALAEARRPKGPTVTMENVGGGEVRSEPNLGEVIRRTAAQVWVRFRGSVAAYRYKDGEPVGVKRSTAGRIRGWRLQTSRWRICAASLPVVAALPPGENEVSKALRAMGVEA